MKNRLSINQVTKKYGDFTALDLVSLNIEAGEFMTLLGPSGSGKTTLLMIIAGFVDPSSGSVLLDDREITSLAPEERNFGLVFQGYALFPHLTVRENVYFPLRVRGISRADAGRQVAEALDLVQLSKLADRYPKQLSGGQQQRVALARAMVFKPELLLLDEPLSALDRALRKDMQQELTELHQRVGTTFIYVTHDQEEALSMSDRIAILRDGGVEQVGNPERLYENPATAFVAGFLGKNNFLNAESLTETGSGVTYTVGGRRFRIDGAGSAHKDLPLCVAIRPERIRLCREQNPKMENTLPGTIKNVAYFGQTYEVTVATDVAGEIVVSAYLGADRPRVGEAVWLEWDDTSGVVLPGTTDASDGGCNG